MIKSTKMKWLGTTTAIFLIALRDLYGLKSGKKKYLSNYPLNFFSFFLFIDRLIIVQLIIMFPLYNIVDPEVAHYYLKIF